MSDVALLAPTYEQECNVRGAMNCATTNAFFVNEKLLFRNGITPNPGNPVILKILVQTTYIYIKVTNIPSYPDEPAYIKNHKFLKNIFFCIYFLTYNVIILYNMHELILSQNKNNIY